MIGTEGMARTMTDQYAMNPALDPRLLAIHFARRGRLHIPEFLAPGAAQLLYDHLRARTDWRLIVNQDDLVFELDRTAQAALTEDARQQLDDAVYAKARTGFQYRYELIRIPDSEAESVAETNPLVSFARFMTSPEVLAFLSEVLGGIPINFSDAQATAYGPGHFLTTHDDEVATKNRKAAYVYNLSASWRTDWGGLLMFNGSDGHIEEAFLPKFNALNLFSVPQHHSVSYVVPFVPYRRYAVTGWLRQR
jgi:Rps23 Pro-64 3,4-dihydroxylase Tpa1-like proline 4-hydroxylase